MKNIDLMDGINIPLAETGDLGISVSGGADSAILLYILMALLGPSLDRKLYIFSTFSNEKGRSNAFTVANVIERCIQLTGFTNIIHIGQYVVSQNNINLFKHVHEYLDTGKIVQSFSAVTANPSSLDLISFTGINEDASNRLSGEIRSIKDLTREIYIPFTNVNKKYIAALYQLYGLTDDLFPLTRSCEALCRIPESAHCGKCWWCEERKWAFDKL